MKLSRVQLCGLIIVILYVVGFWGFFIPSLSETFEKLVPFHLLAVFGILFYTHSRKNTDFKKFILTTFVAGFIIELMGVHTGLIFGEYTYGNTLGFKIAEIPVLMGVNWIIMIYSAGVFVQEFNIRNKLMRAMFGAVLLTLVDIIMEPIAIKFDYWTWNNMEIPVQNLSAWFLFSFVLLFLFYNLKFKKTNPIASIVFVVQALFFLALNLAMD